MPESCSIVCMHLAQHQTLRIFIKCLFPCIDMLFLLLKNAKDSSYSSVILFDTVKGQTYRENTINTLTENRRETQEVLISDYQL